MKKTSDSFLTNRRQFVSIDGFYSQTKISNCGALKDFILGPLLFLLCINFRNALENCIIHYFAGDSNLIYKNKSPFEYLLPWAINWCV